MTDRPQVQDIRDRSAGRTAAAAHPPPDRPGPPDRPAPVATAPIRQAAAGPVAAGTSPITATPSGPATPGTAPIGTTPVVAAPVGATPVGAVAAGPPPPAPPPPVDAPPASPPAPPDRLADQPTDHLEPPGGHERKRTLTFEPVPGAGGQAETREGRPAADGQPGSRRRRWLWVLLALLPVVVIAVTGIVWWLLLGAG